MVSAQIDIEAEVNDLIEFSINAGEPIPSKWIMPKILANHPDIAGDDTDFYVICAQHHVQNTVRTCLRAWKTDEDDTPEQMRFEGFECLQKAYLVDRDGEQTIVPLTACSKNELVEKINEYRKMAAGCTKHANELERFVNERFADA